MDQIRLHQNPNDVAAVSAEIEVLLLISRYLREELEKLQSVSTPMANALERRLAEELAMLRARDPDQPMFAVRTTTLTD